MFARDRDTIFALASGVGRAAIAVIRVSGPGCHVALTRIAPGPPLADRVASVRLLRDPASGEPLDRALVIRFSAPRSFTGEDMAELQVTGGRAVVAAVLRALAAAPGFRPAEPGEFAWRAFVIGKLDLAAIDGLGDLVAAETEAQRRQALRVADGALSRTCAAVRAHLIEAMALTESQIDFSDVEDAETLTLAEARESARAAADDIDGALAASQGASRLREGFVVVIAGPPNSGKSTLMNALAGRDVAITSAIPGTTRDAIEVFLDLKGYPVTLVDTAGIRETDDPLEREGVARALRRAAQADLTLWLEEAGSIIPESLPPAGALRVRSKIDAAVAPPSAPLAISAKTGEGIDRLLQTIAEIAEERMSSAAPALLIHQRHEIAFRKARRYLDAALDPHHMEAELVAEDLRLAIRELDGVVGRVDAEQVLDEIFGRLCVGK